MKRINEFIDKYQNIILIAIILLSIYLISVFPPSGDDFNRLNDSGFMGFSEGIDRVKRLYKTLNGRIIGNEISYLFINRFPRTLMKSLNVILYIVLMMKLLNIKRVSGLFIILGSIILMPLPVFRQILVWSSGFYNYIPPIILILILMNLFIYHRNKFTKGELVSAFLLSLIASLFMENLTIYMIFLPILLAFIFWNKDNMSGYIASFSGSLLGAIIMFMSPIYWKVANNEDGYREIAEDIFTFVSKNWEIFSEYMIVYNIFVMILFSLALGIGIYNAFKNKKFTLQILALINLLILIPFCFLELPLWGNMVNMFFHISFYLLIILITVKEFNIKKFSSKLIIFSCISMAITMGPLLFVSPVSARNFFTPMFFNILIIVSLFRLNDYDIKFEKYFNRICAAFIMVAFSVYLVVYSVNYRTYMERDRLIREAIEDNKNSVQIPAYKFKSFNGGYGTDSMGNYYYKEKQQDLKIEITE